MTFPANYAVIAEDELTYVTGGGVIANVLPAVMTSENWRTFSTNMIKIVGNTFMSRFVNAVLGTAFGTNYAFGGIFEALNNTFVGKDLPNSILQFLGGVATIYTLGTDSAVVLDKDSVIDVTGAKV